MPADLSGGDDGMQMLLVFCGERASVIVRSVAARSHFGVSQGLDG